MAGGFVLVNGFVLDTGLFMFAFLAEWLVAWLLGVYSTAYVSVTIMRVQAGVSGPKVLFHSVGSQWN